MAVYSSKSAVLIVAPAGRTIKWTREQVRRLWQAENRNRKPGIEPVEADYVVKTCTASSFRSAFPNGKRSYWQRILLKSRDALVYTDVETAEMIAGYIVNEWTVNGDMTKLNGNIVIRSLGGTRLYYINALIAINRRRR